MRFLTARLPVIRSVIGAVDVGVALAVAIGAWARISRLGEYDNQYYTATVASMLHSLHNFLYGSFDPGGVVTVDKPPGAFWIQALSAYVFGVHAWSVNLPQVVVGILAPIILYFLLKKDFGRVAAAAAASVFVVIPASIVIDSRNEPDGLLYFALLLAAVCIIRAARTGKWRWLLAFSLLVGFAFNVKMLVAFVPLPAFLLYYLLSARVTGRKLAIQTTVATIAVLVFSFSWAAFVGLTPADSRPYIGSTRDNSIWTLIFEYNGLSRFTSFIGPRPGQPQTIAPGVSGTPQGSQPAPSQPQGSSPYQAIGMPQATAPTTPNAEDHGVFGLFLNPLAAQLGWLFPVALLMLAVAVAALFSERLYRHPLELMGALRGSSIASQAVLWVGWFVTAAVVFGVATATATHPYYLVGMAMPMAAVIGIGVGTAWKAFQEGTPLSWAAPGVLLGAAVYQALMAQGSVGDLIVALVLVAVLLAFTLTSSALWRKLAQTPLARGGMAAGALALLVIPLAFGHQFGGRIAGAGPGPQGPSRGVAGGPNGPLESMITAFTLQQGYGEARFAVGVVSAREAAAFIIAGVPVVAIGGFSGGDPIFTVASFREMVEQGDLVYFLMPRETGEAGSLSRSRQGPILDYIRATWRDVSAGAGLPKGSLFRYSGP